MLLATRVVDADKRPIHDLHYDLKEIYACLKTTDEAAYEMAHAAVGATKRSAAAADTPAPTTSRVPHAVPVFFDFAYAQRRHRTLVELWERAGGKTT